MNVLPRASTTMEWNKRICEDDIVLSSPSPKRAKYSYHIRLASESSMASEGEESVDTIQGHETEVAKDTSDTDSRSDDSDYDVIEYEVASLSESDAPFGGYLSTSSGCSNDVPVMDIEDVVAAVLADSSLEGWAYDTEFSSTDEKEDSNLGRQAEFKRCAQCKGENDVPRFRLCTSCFQHCTCWCCKMIKDNSCFPLCSACYKVRKKFYPPRPRRTRKQRTPELASTSSTMVPPVNIEKLKSCLDGISQDSGFAPSSQDSGLGSSQELPPLQLDKIVIPEAAIEETKKRRRSQDSDEYFTPKVTKLDTKEDEQLRSSLPEFKELCIVCNERSKNSAFLHGNSAHACCCYRCAIQCWKTQKKCPICSRKVKNVVKLFTI